MALYLGSNLIDARVGSSEASKYVAGNGISISGFTISIDSAIVADKTYVGQQVASSNTHADQEVASLKTYTDGEIADLRNHVDDLVGGIDSILDVINGEVV